MTDELLACLRCPLDPNRETALVREEQSLRCEGCSSTFPIKNGIPVLVLRSALRQRARGLGARDYARSPLALSPSDLHPSALGHAAIAEELAAWLKTRIAP